eukprot:11278977-Heterocapsa_arctica.AAC.1
MAPSDARMRKVRLGASGPRLQRCASFHTSRVAMRLPKPPSNFAAIVITTTTHFSSSFGKGAACTTTWPRPKPSITVTATLNVRRPP